MRRSIKVFAALLGITLLANVAFPDSAFALIGRSKQAISKSCSQQADAKGLHGKARKAFRAKCKRHGGNPT
jgi:hypothetical protein